MNQEKKFDAGPLITLKKGLNLEELKKNASIEDRFVNLIIKIINSGRKDQRFAVNWRAGQDQKLIISVGATLLDAATADEIKELKSICGHAIVPEKNVTGVVHNKLEKMELVEAAKKGKDSIFKFFKSCVYKGGLSFGIEYEHNEEFFSDNLELVFTTRSTRQFDSQNLNNIAKMCLFYDYENDTGTKYDPVENEFTNREYALAFHIRRTSMEPIAQLISKTILDALIKVEKDIQLSDMAFFKSNVNYADYKHVIYDEVWEKDFRCNKQNIADALLTTICVACGYNDTSKSGRFWIKLSDDEIVFKAVQEAKKIGVKLDLNKIPDPLKGICNQPDFSTTALMFAAKKTDIPIAKRLDLIIFLLKNGADPAQQDNNGHDAIGYAESAGNTEIAAYLRMTMSFKSAYQSVTNGLFKKNHQSAEEKSSLQITGFVDQHSLVGQQTQTLMALT